MTENWQPGDPVYPQPPSIVAWLAEALDVPAELLETDTHNHWSYWQNVAGDTIRHCYGGLGDPGWSTYAARWQPDDPTPTTGGPADHYEFPAGCRCYIKEDVDYGDVLTRPPGGCPAHSCTCLSLDSKHAITCLITVLSQPHAMVTAAGDVVYPDSLADAATFTIEHDARPVNQCAFTTWSLQEAGHG